jgi:hypothetical protein
MQESRTGSMVSKQWVKETREYFVDFLRATNFPEMSRQGERGSEVEYPEWLSMLIGVVAVKSKEKTDVGIHRLSTRYWKELCGKEVTAAPISESRWRMRLKKSALSLERVQDTFSKCFHQSTCDKGASLKLRGLW